MPEQYRSRSPDILPGQHRPLDGQYYGISQQDTQYNGEAPILPTPHSSSSIQQLTGQENVRHGTLRAPTIPTVIPLRRRMSNFASDWWLELLSCLFALASLFAIVGTTYAFRGLPLPKWPYDLSINTLVSVYMVAMKSAILLVVAEGLGQMKWSWFRRARPLSHLEVFDEASRGPWGSLELLWTLRFQRLGPAIGAIIMILSTIMDPFGQQIVRFYSCNILDPDAVSSLWTARSPIIFKHVFTTGMNRIPPLHPQMRSAVHLGIFRSNTTDIRVDAVCPTGDCDFPEVYHTIGFQSKCSDVSDKVEVHVNGTYFCDASETDKWGKKIKDFSWQQAVNFTIPESDLFNQYREFAIRCPEVSNLEKSIKVYSLMVYDGPNQDHCAGSQGGTTSGWRCQGFGATMCQVRPVLYSYQGAVRNGRFTENVTNITPIPFDSNWRNRYGDYNVGVTWSAIDIGCLTQVEKESLKRDNYTLPNDNSTNWMAYDLTGPAGSAYLNGSTYFNFTGTFSPTFSQGEYDPNDPTAGFLDDDGNLRTDLDNSTLWRRPNVTDIRPQCIYQIQDIDLLGLETDLVEIITGKLIFPSGDFTAPLGDSVAIPEAFYRGSGNISVASMQEIMDNMVNTLSTSLRSTKSTPDGSYLPIANFPVTGKVYRADTCVSITWAWLAFPAALNLMTVVFMVLLFQKHTLSSRWQGDPLTQHGYKTAVVPLLLHGFERQQRYYDNREETTAEAEKRMKSTRLYGRRGENVFVRFEGRGKDWRLVEVEGDTFQSSPEIRKV